MNKWRVTLVLDGEPDLTLIVFATEKDTAEYRACVKAERDGHRVERVKECIRTTGSII